MSSWSEVTYTKNHECPNRASKNMEFDTWTLYVHVSNSILLCVTKDTCIWNLHALNTDYIFWKRECQMIHPCVKSWWRHQMETFSALLAICAGNSPVPGEFPAQRPVTQSFDVFFDLCPNKRLSKQSWGWWSETPSSSLWRHNNVSHAWLLG